MHTYTMIIGIVIFIPKSRIQRFHLNNSLTVLSKRETKTKRVTKCCVTPIIIYDTLLYLTEAVQIQMAIFFVVFHFYNLRH
jgi:hypothetical protein